MSGLGRNLQHGRAAFQPHGYRNTYGQVTRGYSGYAGMMGGLAGPVTLARVLPGQAYSGLRRTSSFEAAYGHYGVFNEPTGAPAPTGVSISGGQAPGSMAPGNRVTGQQVAQWFQTAINALTQAGVRIPGVQQGTLPPAGGPSLPGNPGNSGPTTTGYHPSQGYETPGSGDYTAPRKFPMWGYFAIGLGALALGGGAAFYKGRRKQNPRRRGARR